MSENPALDSNKIAMSMLAMAETLRTQSPGKVKMAIKCARGALNLNLSKETEAHCHLQYGKLLLFYTDMTEMARTEIQQAYVLMHSGGNFQIEQRLEALSLLAELFVHTGENQVGYICQMIRSELSASGGFDLVHHKLWFHLIELTKNQDDVPGALSLCEQAILHCTNNKPLELYFRLTKHLIAYQKLREEPASSDIAHIGALIKDLESDPSMEFHVKSIKGFFMCTKLAFMLTEGQSRSSKSLLRQIQQEVTKPKKDPHITGFRWMDDVSMTVFACVTTVVSALIQCSYERAMKYHSIAVKHADDIITKSCRFPQEFAVVRCVNQMKMASLELMALCNVMTCRPQRTLSNVHEMIAYSIRSGGHLLFEQYAPHIQYVLGLLSSYLQKDDDAERHFLAAISMTEKSGDKNKTALLYVNLAMTYLNQLKMREYYDVSEKLTTSKVSQCTTMVRSNVKFATAYFLYLNQKTSDCQTILHDLLVDSKAEDFFRLHGLSLLMLSLLMPVDEQVLKPTVDWTKKSYDHAVTVWSHKIYKELLEKRGEDTTEIVAEAQKALQALDLNELTTQLNTAPAANLLQWYSGDVTKYLPKDDYTG